MPEAAAGSSGKSFLQRARGKVLRWLRRSLRTTHQVNVPLFFFFFAKSPLFLVTVGIRLFGIDRTVSESEPRFSRSPS